MRMLLIVAAALLSGKAVFAQPPAAQPVALPRADAHVVLGWQNLHKGSRRITQRLAQRDLLRRRRRRLVLDRQPQDAGGLRRRHPSRAVPLPRLVIDGRQTTSRSRVSVAAEASRSRSSTSSSATSGFTRTSAGASTRARDHDARNTSRSSSSTCHARLAQVTPAHEGPEHRFIARPFAEPGSRPT